MTPEPTNGTPHEDGQMVEIELGRIVLRDHSLSAPQYIYLREVQGERSFPIVIGYPEASEIQRIVTGLKTERPMTHELLHEAIATLGARLASVDIVDVRKNTFYARLILENESGELLGELDARPSDSIALAIRARCPLRVSESILELVRTDQGKDSLDGDSIGPSSDQPPESPPESPPGLPDF